MMKRIILLIYFLAGFSLFVHGQSVYQDFYQQSLDINKSGMMFLGGWAIANMATGTYGWLTHKEEKKYFHQMNAAWNLVNAGIATFALLQAMNTDVSAFSDAEILSRQIRTENIFLFNAGLDILYMAGGYWMIRAARNNEKRHDLLKGYGQSVILQGAFLFLFDLVKFGIQYNHRMNFTDSLTGVGFSPQGLSLVLRF